MGVGGMNTCRVGRVRMVHSSMSLALISCLCIKARQSVILPCNSTVIFPTLCGSKTWKSLMYPAKIRKILTEYIIQPHYSKEEATNEFIRTNVFLCKGFQKKSEKNFPFFLFFLYLPFFSFIWDLGWVGKSLNDLVKLIVYISPWSTKCLSQQIEPISVVILHNRNKFIISCLK